MKIVFMGTPEFAVPTLEALIKSPHEVAGVFTQPDKPVGRKQILTPPPVKVCAEDCGIPVFQPNTLRNGQALEIIKEISPDVIVAVAYGKILPKEILDFPKYGCICGHASLLPRHRGASPIQWAVVSGDKKAGITTMLMDEGIDTGDMLLTASTEVEENETAGTLHDKLCVIAADLMIDTLKGLEKGEITPQKQDDSLSCYAPMITKEMGFLDFKKPAQEICNLIRGFNPWPNAYFFLDGKRIKVFSASPRAKTDKAPATVISSSDELIVACADGTSLALLEIQPEGAKRMQTSDYLKGHRIEVGTVIGE